MVAVWSVVAGVFGLAIGSFLNVVIYRVPAGLSVVSPPSRCPVCEHQIRERHNIPVVGWLLLRGRCYDCHAPISARYPLVEAATGVAWAVVTAALVAAGDRRLLAAALLAVTATIAFGMMLIDGHRPPARWFLPAIVLVVALTAVGAAV